jgi:hypothetical protein
MRIQCLAFSRDRRRPEKGAAGWLLAAGDAGGVVALWYGSSAAPRSVCRGSSYHVHAVAFSPDGMTLASVGRNDVKLWDISSGQLLLNVEGDYVLNDVAFAPDGRRLAFTSADIYGNQSGKVEVWGLETGRGVQVLRGHVNRVEKVVFSPDDRLLAALAQDCRVAVWDRERERLLHVFEAPIARWVDNAALAFSPAGRQLAFSGSSETAGRAVLWDVASGERIKAWDFPPGLNNVLAFHPSKKLLLCQLETSDGRHLPDASQHPRDHPRVCRVRDLFGDPKDPLVQIKEFNRRCGSPVAADDGHLFAMVGHSGVERTERLKLLVFNGLTGEEVWSMPLDVKKGESGLSLDRAGQFLTINHPDGKAERVELPSGKFLGPADQVDPRTGWHPEMPYRIAHSVDNREDWLVPRGANEPVLALSGWRGMSGGQTQFDHAGLRYAWGTPEGSVRVCDIPEVQRRLAEFRLGW